MKIFVSYSRRDAGDLAKHITESLIEEHDIFTDINYIQMDDVWSNTVEENISTFNIFIVIVTFGALKSPEIEREVLEAQLKHKKIVTCFYGNIRKSEIKWGLDKVQGIQFASEYQLVRELYSKIEKYEDKTEVREHTKAGIEFITPSVDAGSQVTGNKI